MSRRGEMSLAEFIAKKGDAACAKLWGVKPRTVASWRLGERSPRREQARVIVATSPVTYAGIYQVPESQSA